MVLLLLVGWADGVVRIMVAELAFEECEMVRTGESDFKGIGFFLYKG